MEIKLMNNLEPELAPSTYRGSKDILNTDLGNLFVSQSKDMNAHSVTLA
jgi:hypothetical protein